MERQKVDFLDIAGAWRQLRAYDEAEIYNPRNGQVFTAQKPEENPAGGPYRVALLLGDRRMDSDLLALEKMAQAADCRDENLEFVSIDLRARDLPERYPDLLTAHALVTEEAMEIRAPGRLKALLPARQGFEPRGCHDRSLDAAQLNALHELWNDYDIICTSSDFDQLLLGACYGLPVEQLALVGLPRCDLMFLPGAREKLARICPRATGRRAVMLSLSRPNPVLAAWPGGPEGFAAFLAENGMIGFSTEPIPEFAGLPGLEVLDEALLGRHGIQFYELAAAFDLLLPDGDPLIFDFLAADIPVLLLENRALESASMLQPFGFFAPGPVARTPGELRAWTLAPPAGEWDERRRTLFKFFHRHQDTAATGRLLRKLGAALRMEGGWRRGTLV